MADPSAPSDGRWAWRAAHLVARDVAGLPAMLTWARLAADVAGEIDPTTGRYTYRTVLVTVPRQSAKSTTIWDVIIGRMLAYPGFTAAYAYQAGKNASEAFQRQFRRVERGPLAPHVRTYRRGGDEKLFLPGHQHSQVRAFPPRDGALRSVAEDLVVIDEAQEHSADLGNRIDQTIRPVGSTRRRFQQWLVGTAPHADLAAGYFASHYAAARRGAAGYCLIDYGADDGEDPADPAVWHRRHPGLAAGLTTPEWLAGELEHLGVEAFAREYMNVWPTVGAERLIPPDLWAASADPDQAYPTPGPHVVLGVDVGGRGSDTAIVAAWTDPDGRVRLELVDVRPGQDWAPAQLDRISRSWRVGAVILDTYGPAVGLAETLRQAYPAVPLVETGTRDYLAACSRLLSAVTSDRIRYRPAPALDAAARDAAPVDVGDAGWRWSRRRSAGPITALVAATLAHHGALRPTPAAPTALFG